MRGLGWTQLAGDEDPGPGKGDRIQLQAGAGEVHCRGNDHVLEVGSGVGVNLTVRSRRVEHRQPRRRPRLVRFPASCQRLVYGPVGVRGIAPAVLDQSVLALLVQPRPDAVDVEGDDAHGGASRHEAEASSRSITPSAEPR